MPTVSRLSKVILGISLLSKESFGSVVRIRSESEKIEGSGEKEGGSEVIRSRPIGHSAGLVNEDGISRRPREIEAAQAKPGLINSASSTRLRLKLIVSRSF